MAEGEDLLPKGLRFFNPAETAPDFVVGTLIVSMREFVDYVKDNPEYLKEHEGKKQLHVQLLISKGNKLYGKVDTYKKEDAPAGKKPPIPGKTPVAAPPAAAGQEVVNDDYLPF